MQTPFLIAQIILIILNLQRKLHLNMYFCFDLQKLYRKNPDDNFKILVSYFFFVKFFICCLIRQNEFT